MATTQATKLPRRKTSKLFSFQEFCFFEALNDMTNYQRTLIKAQQAARHLNVTAAFLFLRAARNTALFRRGCAGLSERRGPAP